MTFIVDISEKAKADIRANARWWSENRSLKQAGEWVTRLEDAIESLHHMPRRCARAAEASKLDLPLHNLFFGVSSSASHRVLFIIDDNIVYVLRVLSTRQAPLKGSGELH